MLDVHIVTDSCAHFSSGYNISQYPITVLPNKITVNGQVYQDGVNIRSEELMALMMKAPVPPVVTPPSEEDYSRVFTQLQRENRSIISIHASREIYTSWQNARRAVQPFTSSGLIAVIDSQSLSVGQGMLIHYALEVAKTTGDFDSLVRKIRGAVERIYSIYCVETTETLLQNNILSSAHSILGTMLGIKPFITIENGRLVAIEKARTRAQIIDRIVEFAIEFEEIDEGIVIQPKASPTSELSRLLQDRLSDEFPSEEFPIAAYSPALAALIGYNANGLVIMEKEMGEANDF